MPPTNFPTSVDSFTDPISTNPMTSPDHAGQHANANDAIVAIETAVGTTGSPVFIPLTQKGAASGVAALNASGTLFTTQSAETVPVTFAVLTPFTAGVAAFEILQTSWTFNGQYGQGVYLGWNAAESRSGAGGVAGQAALVMGLENNYLDSSAPGGGTHNTTEWWVGYSSPDGTSVHDFRPFACTVLAASNSSHGAQVQVDIGTDGTGSFSILGGASDAALVTWNSTVANFFAPIALTAPSYLELVAGTPGSAIIAFNDTTTPYWQTVLYHGDHSWYLWDVVNGRFQAKFGGGSTSALATTEFQSLVKADGGLATVPPTISSTTQAVTIGTAVQNTAAYDRTLLVSVTVTAAVAAIIYAGTGSTAGNAASGEIAVTGALATASLGSGVFIVPLRIAAGYYGIIAIGGTSDTATATGVWMA